MKRNYDRLMEALDHYMKKYEVSQKEDLLIKFEASSDNKAAQASTKPKYIFMNRLVLDKKQILAKLSEANYELVKYERQDEESDENVSFKNFIDNMTSEQFVKDTHLKNLYVFKHNSSINKTVDLFKEGHLLQIDKVNSK